MTEQPSNHFGSRAMKLTTAPGVEDKDANPSIGQADRVKEQASGRIPMSAPQLKLLLPSIPGYHSHWLNDTSGRIAAALQGGYEFISAEEVHVNSRDLGGDPASSGQTDMGSRVSVVVGSDERGNPLRAYAMKIREEWYKADQAAIQARTDGVEDAMRQGKTSGGQGADNSNRYVKTVNLKSSYQRSA